MKFNKKIETIIKKKYYIYKIDNFLDQNLYQDIKKNFPKIDNNQLDLNGKHFGKKAFYRNELPFENSSQKIIFSKFEEIVYSKKFFYFFMKNFFFLNVLNQTNFLTKLRYLRFPKLHNDSSSFLDFLFSKISVSYDFSFIKNNGGIYPHVDALRKYLSLMLYFPDDDLKEKSYGTTFWDSNDQNYNNTFIINPNELNEFKSTNKIIYKTPFVSNCLYFFLRNNYTWHTVEPQNISENYVRKSININFIYKN